MEYRHELKYVINYAQYAILRVRLKALMKPDEHVNSDGYYTVRSVYFDDYVNTAYNDKYAGIPNRQKFRVRIYNYSDQFINLERKIKRDTYVHKQSAPLTRCQVEEIMHGHYDTLRDCSHPLHMVFYHELRSKVTRPRVIVDYEREPYVMAAGNVRITFDRHVRAGMENWDIFNPKMVTQELFDPGCLVMEVKYSQFLPSIISGLLPRSQADYSAVSKYVMGCDKTLYKRLFDV